MLAIQIYRNKVRLKRVFPPFVGSAGSAGAAGVELGIDGDTGLDGNNAPSMVPISKIGEFSESLIETSRPNATSLAARHRDPDADPRERQYKLLESSEKCLSLTYG